MNRISFRSWRSGITGHLGALVLLILSACMIHAQVAGSGNIQGTVTDATGAVVPSAKVVLADSASGVTHVTQSNSVGEFLFPNMQIATYNLKVTATGFETFEQRNIVLEVGSSIAINPKLTIGKTDETVEVHADALALQTEDTSFKQTIDKAAVNEMPLNGRQMTALITLSGGSSPAPAGDFTGSKYSYQTISVSVAGGMGNTTEWKLDGGNNNDYMSNSNLPFPFPDAVQEFSVEAIDLGARGGGHSGGLVNVITKSGTNQYHGDAFEFIRNNFLDATNFFSASKDTLHQNQFGGTFGGPVIPGHKKLFGFAGYQRTVSKYSTSVNTMYIPTAANLQGDFSVTDPPPGSVSSCGNSPQQLYDPLTGNPIPGNKYASPPAFNKQALNLMKYLPTASSPGVAYFDPNCGVVKFSLPGAVFDNQFVTRADYYISGKHSLYGRYMIDGYQFPAFFFPNNILVTFQAPGQYQRVQTAVVGETWTISPNLVNSFHVSGSKRVDNRAPAPGINSNTLGITQYDQMSTGLVLTASTSGKNANWSTYCGTCTNGFFNVDNEGVSDDLTWVKGKHQVAIGGEFVRVHFNAVVGYDANGKYTFNGEYSGSGPTGQLNGKTVYGDSNLDFLWGALSAFDQSKQQQLALRGSVPSLYIEDTYHASPRVTVVGGIRWSPEFMPSDYFNRGTTFDYSAFLAGKTSSVYPNAPAGTFFYGDPGVTRQFTQNSPWLFDPNLGVSLDPFGRGNTVIRAGVEMAYDLANYYTTNRVHQNPPFATDAVASPIGPICFSEPWLAGGTGYGCNMVGGSNTSPYPQPALPTAAQAVFPAQAQYLVLPKQFHISDTIQWTFSVQHQFPRGWQAQIDYIGTKTSHMQAGLGLSPAIYTPGTWGPNATGCGPVVTTGPAAVAAGTTNPKVGSPCSTTANQRARFALTEASPIQGDMYAGGASSATIGDVAWANYNGMVATLQHRLSSTFSMLSNYTWSKCLNTHDATGDTGGNDATNPYNQALDYGRCGSDYRNIFNTTLVATSRFPLQGVAGYLANNWELAPLFHIMSGAPINVTSGSDISLTDIGNDRPNRVPGVNPINHVKIQGGTTATTQATRGYLNPAAFCANSPTSLPCPDPVAPGTYGNLSRNAVNGPMFFEFDAQLSRIWPVAGDRWKLDTRLEAFNVLNHPNFANPSSSNPSGSTFGTITSTAGGASIANIPALTARVFQGSVKIIF
ncbi:MAG TPA: carboxypeptidase-like regulatory domain-containing protein [Acidobacteriaceae bacterium]|nr:carboxypeptidase-like regulatory domain-containing protein [Acidobacteriaceae bacterium]